MKKLLTMFALLSLLAMGSFLACNKGETPENKGKTDEKTAGTEEKKSEAPASGVKEISFLTMQLKPTFNEYVEGLIKEYEKLHPDVKVNWLDYPAQNYDTKLLSTFMSKNSPDIFNTNPEAGPNYLLRNYTLNLDEYITPEEKSIYLEPVISGACTYKDTFYALPWYLAVNVTMINTDIYKKAGLDPEKAPHTWDDITADSAVIKEKTGLFGTLPILTENGSLKGYLFGDGVQLVDESGTKAIFNTEEGYKTLQWITDLYQKELIPKESLTAQHRRPIELFKAGKIAIFVTGPQFLKLIKNDAPDIYKAVKVAPSIVGKNGKMPVIVMSLALSNQSKHPKEAADFAKFITNAQNQLAFSKIVTIMPSVKTALDDPYFTNAGDNPTPEDIARIISAQQMKDAIVEIYPRENSGELYRVMDDALQKACLGQLSVKEALDEAAAGWTKILQKSAANSPKEQK